MNPLVHAELSWLVAQGLRHRRDRILVTVAGVIPDVDGLSLLGGVEAYGAYHHVLTHGFVAGLAFSLLLGGLARRRVAVGLLSLVAFHLHLLADLAGSGPGWPLHYYWPISMAEWFWAGQWDLASWQNTSIGLTATLVCLSCALFVRRTPVELFSLGADAKVVAALRRRFLPAKSGPEGS